MNEQDPAFLAVQVRTLNGALEAMAKVQKENHMAIQRAFAMVDVHQQILQRVARDVAFAISETRRLQVDGDITLASGDLGALKLLEGGALDLPAYYAEYRSVAASSAERDVELALILWSQGFAPEDAVLRAKVEREQKALKTDGTSDDADPDYEVQFFGGTDGQSHHQQDAQATQTNG